MSFFDAPWHIVLLLLAALILFGSSRLPGAARALGSSMNIFKKAVKGEDDHQVNASQTAQATYPLPPAQLTGATGAQSQQAQIDDLQRQLRDLQQESSGADGRQGPDQSDTQSRPNSQSY